MAKYHSLTFSRSFRLVSVLFGALGKPSRRRQTVADLSSLDDHLLRDIGVTQAEFIELTNGPPGR